MKDTLPDFDKVISLLAAMPPGQLLLLGLTIATWIIGGNILVAMHYVRTGKHWASGFKPFAFPYKDFNAREWLILVLLALISISFLIAGVTYRG